MMAVSEGLQRKSVRFAVQLEEHEPPAATPAASPSNGYSDVPEPVQQIPPQPEQSSVPSTSALPNGDVHSTAQDSIACASSSSNHEPASPASTASQRDALDQPAASTSGTAASPPVTPAPTATTASHSLPTSPFAAAYPASAPLAASAPPPGDIGGASGSGYPLNPSASPTTSSPSSRAALATIRSGFVDSHPLTHDSSELSSNLSTQLGEGDITAHQGPPRMRSPFEAVAMGTRASLEASPSFASDPGVVTATRSLSADSVDSPNRATSLGGRRSSSIRWQSSVSSITRALTVSRQFRTLRDMCGDNFISAASLERLKTVGQGAYATVDLSRYSDASGVRRLVAVKKLKPFLKEEKDLEDFANEAELLRKLRHRNIVEFIGVGGDNIHSSDPALNSTFIVQEYMNCGTLKRMVLNQMFGQSAYSYADALRWLLDIARGLDYLHSSHPMVVHRDMKLENVLLTGDLELSTASTAAKICDFGLHALIVRDDMQNNVLQSLQRASATSILADERFRRIDKKLTRTMSRISSFKSSEGAASEFNLQEAVYDMTGKCGSHMYMAPEVLLQLPYNEKVDIFSVGVIMYEVFAKSMTLAVILQGGTPIECEVYAYKVVEGYRRPIPEWWPPELAGLVSDCWAAESPDRPTAAELLERLEALRDAELTAQMEAAFRAAREQAAAEGAGGGCSCCNVM